jgi:hypothetical protein
MPVDPSPQRKHDSDCTAEDSPTEAKDEDELVTKRLKDAKIPGGFIWLYDDIKKRSAPGRATADYAQAINKATTG